MSTFEVKIVKLDGIEPIPGADRIELAVIGEYRSVVQKGTVKAGDYVIYIPESAVVPDYLLKRMGLVGKLAGAQRNRVKAILIQNRLSQGLVYPVHTVFGGSEDGPFVVPVADGSSLEFPGVNIADVMGIVKYAPVIPASMSGEIYYAGRDVTYSFDIENIKKYPKAFVEGEDVVFTEKLHGTYCQLICIPEIATVNYPDIGNRFHLRVDVPEGTMYFAIASKGRADQGMCFHWTSDQPNVYIRAVQPYIKKIASNLLANSYMNKVPVVIMGEVFGAGIQDLTYGMVNTFEFRMFDVRIGYRTNGVFVNIRQLENFSKLVGVPLVPIVYQGPYSKEVVQQYTDNVQSQFDPNQMSEGIVIFPTEERYDVTCGPSGRVKMKSVNRVYLARKNKNATEYN